MVPATSVLAVGRDAVCLAAHEGTAGNLSLGKLSITLSSSRGFMTRANVTEITATTPIVYSTGGPFIEVPIPYTTSGLNNFISNPGKLFFVEIHFDLP